MKYHSTHAVQIIHCKHEENILHSEIWAASGWSRYGQSGAQMFESNGFMRTTKAFLNSSDSRSQFGMNDHFTTRQVQSWYMWYPAATSNREWTTVEEDKQNKTRQKKGGYTIPSRNLSSFGRKKPPAQQASKAKNFKNQNLDGHKENMIKSRQTPGYPMLVVIALIWF